MTTTRDPLARAAADTAARAELRRQHEARERLLSSLGPAPAAQAIVGLVRAVDLLERELPEEVSPADPTEWRIVSRALFVLKARDAYLKSLAGEEL